jgi:hypothetical protein
VPRLTCRPFRRYARARLCALGDVLVGFGANDVFASFEVDLDVELDRAATHGAVFDVVLVRGAPFVDEDVDPFATIRATCAVHG